MGEGRRALRRCLIERPLVLGIERGHGEHLRGLAEIAAIAVGKHLEAVARSVDQQRPPQAVDAALGVVQGVRPPPTPDNVP